MPRTCHGNGGSGVGRRAYLPLGGLLAPFVLGTASLGLLTMFVERCEGLERLWLLCCDGEWSELGE